MSLKYNGEQSWLGFDQRDAAPSPPTSGQLVYFRSGVLYQLASDGAERAVGSGATLNDIIISSESSTGTPLTVQAPVEAASDAVLVQVKNAAGTVVAKILANGRIQCTGIDNML